MKKPKQDIGKKILSIILIATGVSLALYLYFLKYGPSGNFSSLTGESSLILDEGNGNQRKFQGPVIDRMSILSALLASKNGGEITFKYSIQKNGSVVLSSINNKISQDGNREWMFYLNGTLVAAENINKTIIKPGDLIIVKYE